MMDLDFVQSLIKALDESGLDSIEIERGGSRIRIARTASADSGAALVVPGGSTPPPVLMGSAAAPGLAQEGPPSSETSPGDSGLIEITSPMVGTFYRAPAPDASSYVEVGAICVGRIVHSNPEKTRFVRGEEKGYFLFGGSTVILITSCRSRGAQNAINSTCGTTPNSKISVEGLSPTIGIHSR